MKERWWRIPGTLTPADLRSRAAALDEDAAAGSTGMKSGDRMEKLRAMAKQRRKEKKEGKKRKTNRYV